MTNCLFLAVNYRNPEQAVLFCRAVRALERGGRAAIVLADNSGCFAKADCRSARKELANLGVTIFTPPSNLGYFPGAAGALALWLESHSLPQNVIVANTDINFPDAAILQRLEKLSIPENVMVVAPRIESERGCVVIDQNPMSIKPYSRRRLRVLRLIFSSEIVYRFYEKMATLKFKYRASPSATQQSLIAVAHGSFIILRKSYLARTAGLDFPGFLYGEELFVAAEVAQGGGTILHAPSLRVRHIGGQTTGPLGWRNRVRHSRSSLNLLWKRYYQ